MPNRHRASSMIHMYGLNFAADHTNGKLYEYSLDIYSDDGESIIKQRDTAAIHGGLFGMPGQKLNFDEVEFVILNDTGEVAGTGLGAQPQDPTPDEPVAKTEVWMLQRNSTDVQYIHIDLINEVTTILGEIAGQEVLSSNVGVDGYDIAFRSQPPAIPNSQGVIKGYTWNGSTFDYNYETGRLTTNDTFAWYSPPAIPNTWMAAGSGDFSRGLNVGTWDGTTATVENPVGANQWNYTGDFAEGTIDFCSTAGGIKQYEGHGDMFIALPRAIDQKYASFTIDPVTKEPTFLDLQSPTTNVWEANEWVGWDRNSGRFSVIAQQVSINIEYWDIDLDTGLMTLGGVIPRPLGYDRVHTWQNGYLIVYNTNRKHLISYTVSGNTMTEVDYLDLSVPWAINGPDTLQVDPFTGRIILALTEFQALLIPEIGSDGSFAGTWWDAHTAGAVWSNSCNGMTFMESPLGT